jgi:predicted DNA-binding protein YlxM (UPF0122 family)
MSLDRLDSRQRQIALYERYGALLTENRRNVLDLHLRQDWSLSEIAALQGTSRAAAHDIVRRALQALEEFESRLGLLGEAERQRDFRQAMAGELAGLRQRLARLESRLGEVAL